MANNLSRLIAFLNSYQFDRFTGSSLHVIPIRPRNIPGVPVIIIINSVNNRGIVDNRDIVCLIDAIAANVAPSDIPVPYKCPSVAGHII